MWPVVRILALAVIAVVGVLVAGHGGWLLDTLDRLAAAGGFGPLPRGDGEPAAWAVAAGLAAGAAVATLAPLRRVAGQVVTLLHELGHTVVAAALGARPAGIVLRHDASGHATARWRGRPGPVHRVSLAVTAFVGLPAPAVAAAAGTGLLVAAGPRAVLWALVLAGVVVALLARSPWSLLVAAGLAGLAVAALTDAAAPWTAAAVIAALAAVALRSAADALRRLRLPIPAGDDARAVHRRLSLPPRLVLAGQVAVTCAAGVWTGWLLLSLAGVVDALGPGSR
jgi:hypothetical protein